MNQCKVVLGQALVASLGAAAPTPQQEPITVMIGRCGGCRRSLPWPAPQPGGWASPVNCPECGRWYYTEARNTRAPRLRKGRQPAPSAFAQQGDRQQMADIHRQVTGAPHSPDRRAEPRTPANCTLTAVPLDKGLGLPRVAIEAQLLNLSPSGCCVHLTEPLEIAYLLLDFGAAGVPGVQAMAAVRWTKTSESGQQVGCEFLFGDSGDLPIE